ncbi:MAG: signal peptidase I [Chloroflexi bacterium]|nr:signal peptidase I [Chloroflexota bacterium]
MPWWLHPPRLLDLFSSLRFRVAGHSMEPYLLEGDMVLVSRRFPGGIPRRGDVVAFREPESGGVSIKRICGLPNERIEIIDAAIYVNGESLPEAYVSRAPSRPNSGDSAEWMTGEDEFVLLGDNRGDSKDSRAFGSVARDAIAGRVWYCHAPKSRRGILR